MKINKEWFKENEKEIINGGLALCIALAISLPASPIFFNRIKEDNEKSCQENKEFMEEFRRKNYSFENTKLIHKITDVYNEELKQKQNYFKNALEFEKGIGSVYHLTINFDAINDYNYLNDYLDTISFMTEAVENLAIWFNHVDLEQIDPKVAAKLGAKEIILNYCEGNLNHFKWFLENGTYLSVNHQKDQMILEEEYQELEVLKLEDTVYLGGLENCKKLEKIEAVGGNNKARNNVLLAHVFNDIKKWNESDLQELNLKLYNLDLTISTCDKIPFCKELYIETDKEEMQTLKIDRCGKLTLTGGNYDIVASEFCSSLYMNHCKVEELLIGNMYTTKCEFRNSRINIPIEILQSLNYTVIKNVEAKNIENEYKTVTIDENGIVVVNDMKPRENKSMVRKLV